MFKRYHFLTLLLAGSLVSVSVCGFSAEKALRCAILPPLSPLRHLPDELPADGKYSDQLSVIMTPNEIGHASFMILPSLHAKDATITVSSLAGKNGEIPADAVDLRIVKYWYQDGNAWDSYFADPNGKELVPELLVHDENLIKVDYQKKHNYLRVGDSYHWINYPQGIQYGQFNHLMAQVKDTEKLAPFSLTPNENKMFFLTVRLPKGIAAGNYTGTLTIQCGKDVFGTLKLTVCVLPFELPDSMTWHDMNKRFLAAIRMPKLGDDFLMANRDFKEMERYRKMLYKSMIEHNLVYPLVFSKQTGKFDAQTDEKLFRENLKWMKECGFPTDLIIGGVAAFSWNLIFQKPEKRPKGYEEKFFKAMEDDMKTIREIMGNDIEIYPEGWNEPNDKILQAQRSIWEKVHAQGMKIQQSGSAKHLDWCGYNEDFINCAGMPSSESVRAWHAIGSKVTNYAWPHTGPENPDLIRHTHGMDLYKADLDGTCNYHILEGSGNIWRDACGQFRTFAFVYPISNAILDTLEYEGFRAGIDDIRYATKLRQLAEEATRQKDVKTYYAGKKALRFLALAPADRMDLDTLRMEIINHILKLRELLATNASK